MADTTELLDDAMIDPVTGELIDQKDLAERLLCCASSRMMMWASWSVMTV